MTARIVIAMTLAPGIAGAWDPAGHMLVGQIAWELSPPHVRASVDELVATLENRFNEKQPYHFVTAGCWMDDMRSLPRKDYLWSAWHYVDGPKSETGADFKVPEPPHVVWAIGENLKTLRDAAATKEQRAFALGQLIHWIGDVHQPLHATTWDDRGGNGYMILGVPFSDLFPGVRSNLHTYWDKAFRFDAKDGAIIEAWQAPKTADRAKAPGEGAISEQAKRLLEKHPRASLTELDTKSDAEAWARESHIIGCTKTYPPGDHPRDIEARKLTAEFAAASRPIAERRVVLAGHRLAVVLAELFPER
jgi:S1/P1 Nuclease